MLNSQLNFKLTAAKNDYSPATISS